MTKKSKFEGTLREQGYLPMAELARHFGLVFSTLHKQIAGTKYVETLNNTIWARPDDIKHIAARIRPKKKAEDELVAQPVPEGASLEARKLDELRQAMLAAVSGIAAVTENIQILTGAVLDVVQTVSAEADKSRVHVTAELTSLTTAIHERAVGINKTLHGRLKALADSTE